ncbi:MAG: hypothetical protein WCS94_25455, partial [Verrucomicrobiota bacterium]
DQWLKTLTADNWRKIVTTEFKRNEGELVQLANGRAQISLQLTAGKAVVSVASKGLTTKFMNVMNTN